MPIYEYECEACARRFEKIHKFSDPAIEVCSFCGKGPVRRLLSSPAIQFKGEGWYITDYARKGKPDSSTEKAKTAAGDAAAKTESSDAKPAAQKSETPASTSPPAPGKE